VSIKNVLFIDANQYLDLYRTVGGEKLLAPLQEQQGHILVTTQVVDEVYRRKLGVTAGFLAAKVSESKLNSTAAPDLAPRTVDAIVVRIRKRLQNIRIKLSHDLLEQVSQSKDEVSKALAGVFSQAVAHTEGELQRARVRKEHGNPPGKQSDPLGDQLSWEQILSRCHDKPGLWIITNDSDYGAIHAGEMFLNAALYQELARLYQSEPPVYCFTNIVDGLKHFAEKTGAKAENLPTPEEAEQIKKEQESLPPLDWLTNYDDSYPLAMRLQDGFRMRDSLVAPWLSQVISSGEVILPPTKKADKDGT
jgi:hypothetical protein